MYLKEVDAIETREPIRSTSDAARAMVQNFRDADREYFVSVNLDAKGRPISYYVVSGGSVNAVHFPISSVFKAALLQNAVSVILCHNHPSGTLEPSKEDCDATISMVEAGRMLDIRVLDHFILTPTSYVSLREERGDLFT